jgi:hypothetical protein
MNEYLGSTWKFQFKSNQVESRDGDQELNRTQRNRGFRPHRFADIPMPAAFVAKHLFGETWLDNSAGVNEFGSR